jgi:hypothetical protein
LHVQQFANRPHRVPIHLHERDRDIAVWLSGILSQ